MSINTKRSFSMSINTNKMPKTYTNPSVLSAGQEISKMRASYNQSNTR